ncbi:HNH endonuclease [Lutibacter oricola]|uniref:HNH endonuclease n=1 Tax=Lutibacter oricola TaxID=762486 RepID=A0A1H3H822_9FLAO|nr:HNH endonuclease [Lutibacter oricola]SDY11500.1 HNH endonuclease [Lutibacter oricola]
MNNREKRELIFKIYSDNFQSIVDNTDLKKTYDKDYGYYCPLCSEHFNKQNLDDKTLTLEHNPPKSLGGKGSILTCKKCNSKSGHSIDVELLNALETLDNYSFKPNSEFRTKFHNESTGDKGVNAKIKIDNEGKFIINVDSKNNNPKISEKFFNSASQTYHNPMFTTDLKNIGWQKKLSFNFPKPEPLNEKILAISLLKIAYLLAFEKLGYIFLFSKNMQIIRQQLDNPDKEIIKRPFWIKYDFPDDNLGVNIITKPRELRAFLIIFDLKTNSDKYRFAIVLPSLGENDDKIYDILPEQLTNGKGFINCELNNYINSNYDIKKVQETFKLVRYWDEIIEKME